MNRAMKDSGILWIGEIPNDWEYTFLKHYYDFEKGKNAALYTQEYIGNNLGDYPVYSGQTENGGVMGRINTYDYDIPECLFTTTVGAKVMTAKVLRGQFSLSQNCLIMKKIEESSINFFLYALTALFDYEKSLIPSHMQPSLRIEDLKRYKLFIPSLTEQLKIAEFLDRKCAEVDEMIGLQEQIIEELKAYKQSVITEAVTKGLNPDAPMRDSGIEWIGQIPEHWEVKRIKFIGKAENGLTYTPNDVCDESEGTLVLRSSNIQDGKLAFNDNVYVRSVPDSLKVQVGDIIICSRNGSASLVGKSALVEEDIDASFGAFMMRFRSSNNSKYIHFLLTATISHYKQLFTTTTINQLTIGLINNIAMPFIGDAAEQQAIADYLDEKCADIDSLIQTKLSKIDSLKEYKKSIIYEYVTGKREVE